MVLGTNIAVLLDCPSRLDSVAFLTYLLLAIRHLHGHHHLREVDRFTRHSHTTHAMPTTPALQQQRRALPPKSPQAMRAHRPYPPSPPLRAGAGAGAFVPSMPMLDILWSSCTRFWNSTRLSAPLPALSNFSMTDFACVVSPLSPILASAFLSSWLGLGSALGCGLSFGLGPALGPAA